MNIVVTKTEKNKFRISENVITNASVEELKVSTKDKKIKNMKLTEALSLLELICRKLNILKEDGSIDISKV